MHGKLFPFRALKIFTDKNAPNLRRGRRRRRRPRPSHNKYHKSNNSSGTIEIRNHPERRRIRAARTKSAAHAHSKSCPFNNSQGTEKKDRVQITVDPYLCDSLKDMEYRLFVERG
ncbi:hypothetical protein EVAR_92390_1 [Eumeta japonica]|uniref:Uncharacterized protein n=1 Tax=Eumeta variegata TaxID=151549 RepID=A0A4C1TIR5_EUMVA|nr:hypothetical protein EVAR_92390_1 [Eumeta japonica]